MCRNLIIPEVADHQNVVPSDSDRPGNRIKRLRPLPESATQRSNTPRSSPLHTQAHVPLNNGEILLIPAPHSSEQPRATVKWSQILYELSAEYCSMITKDRSQCKGLDRRPNGTRRTIWGRSPRRTRKQVCKNSESSTPPNTARRMPRQGAESVPGKPTFMPTR